MMRGLFCCLTIIFLTEIFFNNVLHYFIFQYTEVVSRDYQLVYYICIIKFCPSLKRLMSNTLRLSEKIKNMDGRKVGCLLWTFLIHTCITAGEDLYISTSTRIKRLNTDSWNESDIVSKADSQFLGFAVDLGDAKIYYADIADSTLGIYKKDLNESRTERRIIQYPQMMPVGLAVDWVFKHLYWTDIRYRAVMMSNLDGSGRLILVTEGLSVPRGIAVIPDILKLYVGDQGINRLLQCDMDGQNCHYLQYQEDDLIWPNQITINYNENKIYWTEGWIPRVRSCHMNGTNCKREFANVSRDLSLFGITFTSADTYYLSSLFNQTVFSVNSSDHVQTVIEIQHNDMSTFLMSSNAAINQPYVATKHPCVNNHSCKEICVPSPDNVATCACPSGSGELPSTDRSCKDTSEFLLYSSVKDGVIGIADPDLDSIHTILIRGVSPIAVTYDPVNQDIYFSDAALMAIYTCKIDECNAKELLNSSHGISQVEGLAIDFKQRRLYFTNTDYTDNGGVHSWGTIEMVDLRDITKRRRILTNVEKPRAILIDSEKRTLYYTDWGENNPHVGRVRLDGYNREILYQAVNPNGLVILENKLYVTDSRNCTNQSPLLVSSNLDGSYRVDINISEMNNIFSITKRGKDLLITDLEGHTGVYSASGELKGNVRFTEYTNIHFTKRSADIPVDEGTCNTDVCSDLCVTTTHRDYPTCLCSSYDLHYLQKDMQTCSRPSEYLLVADMDGIKMVPLVGSGDKHTYNIIPSSSKCADFHGLARDDRKIYFSSYYGTTIFRANLDGSGLEDFYKTEQRVISLAIYKSVLYWTGITDSKSKQGGIFSTSTINPTIPANQLITGLKNPYDIAVYGRVVYWTGDNPGTIKRILESESSIFNVDDTETFDVNVTFKGLGWSPNYATFVIASDEGLVFRRMPTQTDAPPEYNIPDTASRNLVVLDTAVVFTSSWNASSLGSGIYKYDILNDVTDVLALNLVRPGQIVQVGKNVSTGGHTTKPGSCPPALTENSVYRCRSDYDCYGNLKCCQSPEYSLCTEPMADSVCRAGHFNLHIDTTATIKCQTCSCKGLHGTCSSVKCPSVSSCPDDSRVLFPGNCCPSCVGTNSCTGKPKIANVPSTIREIYLPNGTKCMSFDLVTLGLTDVMATSCSGKSLEIILKTNELCWKKEAQMVHLEASDRQGSTVAKVRVKVKDTSPPTIESCPIEGIKITKRRRDTSVPVTWQPIVFDDNSGVQHVRKTEINGYKNGYEFPEGTSKVEYRIVDGDGNTAVCNFAVVTECGMDYHCPNPPSLHNGHMVCYISRSLVTCEIFRCYDGYLLKEGTPTKYVCGTNGKWGPVNFPARFTTETCFKPVHSTFNIDFVVKFDCPNGELNFEDIDDCVLQTGLSPHKDIQIIYDQGQTSLYSMINITWRIAGTLGYVFDQAIYKIDKDDLVSRVKQVRNKVRNFFQNKEFWRSCPAVVCRFVSSKASDEVFELCPHGTTGRRIKGKLTCAKCAPGSRFEDGDCQLCDPGTYQDRAGQDKCIACPDDTNSKVGAFLLDQCTGSFSRDTLTSSADLSTTIWTIAGVLLALLIVVVIVVVAVKMIRANKGATYSVPAENPNPNIIPDDTMLPEEDPDYAYLIEYQMASTNEIASAMRGRDRSTFPSVDEADETNPYATVTDTVESNGSDSRETDRGGLLQRGTGGNSMDQNVSASGDIGEETGTGQSGVYLMQKRIESNPYETSIHPTPADDHDYKNLGALKEEMPGGDQEGGAKCGEIVLNNSTSVNPYETAMQTMATDDHDYKILKVHGHRITPDDELPGINDGSDVIPGQIRLSSSGSSDN